MNKTPEQRTAETILQQKERVTIDGHEYEVGKPTVATVIMVSEAVSHLPKMNRVKNEDIAYEVLRTAKGTQALGRVAAILILGAKRVKEHRPDNTFMIAQPKRPWWQFWQCWHKHPEEEKPREEVEVLAERITDTYTPRELSQLISRRLFDLQIGDFFGLTTSLAEANILKPTRSASEVDTD